MVCSGLLQPRCAVLIFERGDIPSHFAENAKIAAASNNDRYLYRHWSGIHSIALMVIVQANNEGLYMRLLEERGENRRRKNMIKLLNLFEFSINTNVIFNISSLNAHVRRFRISSWFHHYLSWNKLKLCI